VGEKSRFHLGAIRRWTQRGKTADDARRAEPALAGTVAGEGVDQPGLDPGFQAGGGNDGAPGDPANRGHASDARRTIDQHRAAAALPLGAAPVLHGLAYTQLLPECAEQRDVVARNLYGSTVEGELDGQIKPTGRMLEPRTPSAPAVQPIS